MLHPVTFGNRRDGAINPRPRETADEIWQRHAEDWKRLHDEDGLYVWQVRPSYHFVTVLAEPKREGITKDDAEAKIREVLGDRYGAVSVKLEKAERGPGTMMSEGCCGNLCLGCNNGPPERRLFLLG